MKNKKIDARLKQLMLEHREHIFNGMVPPSPEKFIEDARVERRAAIQYEAAHREYKGKRQRTLALVAGACLVIAITFSVSPEARAFVQRIGLQIARFISHEPAVIEIGIIHPSIVLVNRTEDLEAGYIQSDYLFDNSVGITVSQRTALTNDPAISNRDGNIGSMSLLGEQIYYYKDIDGIIGRLDYNGTLITIRVGTTSIEFFESIVQSVQIVK